MLNHFNGNKTSPAADSGSRVMQALEQDLASSEADCTLARTLGAGAVGANLLRHFPEQLGGKPNSQTNDIQELATSESAERIHRDGRHVAQPDDLVAACVGAELTRVAVELSGDQAAEIYLARRVS